MTRSSSDRSIPRAERIRKAILADLREANEPRALSDLPRARAIARDARELYITAERLRATGAIVRHGLGYHQGEQHRYELPKEKSA